MRSPLRRWRSRKMRWAVQALRHDRALGLRVTVAHFGDKRVLISERLLSNMQEAIFSKDALIFVDDADRH